MSSYKIISSSLGSSVSNSSGDLQIGLSEAQFFSSLLEISFSSGGTSSSTTSSGITTSTTTSTATSEFLSLSGSSSSSGTTTSLSETTTSSSGTTTNTTTSTTISGFSSTSNSFTLTGGENFDILISGAGSDKLLGGGGNDRLLGNGGSDTLLGGRGNDLLLGGGGNDRLLGGAGNDALLDGAGKGYLTGGTGADRFSFWAVTDSGITAATRDTITDFQTAELDKIILSVMDANTGVAGNQAFSFIGTAAFSDDATGQLRFDAVNHIVSGSNDADSSPEFSIFLTGVTSLTATDFIL